jgi:hypothetical protein
VRQAYGTACWHQRPEIFQVLRSISTFDRHGPAEFLFLDTASYTFGSPGWTVEELMNLFVSQQPPKKRNKTTLRGKGTAQGGASTASLDEGASGAGVGREAIEAVEDAPEGSDS